MSDNGNSSNGADGATVYQVDDLIHFTDQSPTFDDLQAAKEQALKRCANGSPYGVWVEATGDLVAIAHEGEVWTC
ncbi:MAG: hypothetical protein GX597_15495 [Anaerolineaceae bacterium]|nr:hypothetical protein [Anaerolineaceae bacterium]